MGFLGFRMPSRQDDEIGRHRARLLDDLACLEILVNGNKKAARFLQIGRGEARHCISRKRLDALLLP